MVGLLFFLWAAARHQPKAAPPNWLHRRRRTDPAAASRVWQATQWRPTAVRSPS